MSFKLNKKAISDTYGADRLKILPKPFVYAASGGLYPDEAAQIFGFNSGDKLHRVLVTGKKRD